ncbi:LppU/SCO3897 family protein [Nocardia amikacinitolerans]|uniref:LppU/SCO3897 family protein n=1 Tax=Nocardia amikacinitolerans TaxID=756689 RepID=UPI000A536F98|nr:hypothetical protein [Nocardia amikacinitolerans]
MSHRLRTIKASRVLRSRGARTVAVLAAAALAMSGCGETKSESMKVGDCGYFTRGNQSWDLERRGCDDPEAALVVVRTASTAQCPGHPFSWASGGRGKDFYVCTHLNAQVGDCFNDPAKNQGSQLYRLRKVPCSTPEAYQVNTRVERHDYSVCTDAGRYEWTARVEHKEPPVSFCLHLVGT